MESTEAQDVNGATFKARPMRVARKASAPKDIWPPWKIGQTLKLDDLPAEIKTQIIAEIIPLEWYFLVRAGDYRYKFESTYNRTSIMLLNSCYRGLVDQYEENYVKSQAKDKYAQEFMMTGTQMEGESCRDRLYLYDRAVQKILSIIQSGWTTLTESGPTMILETANGVKGASGLDDEDEIKLKYVQLGLQMVTYLQATAKEAGVSLKTVYGGLTPPALLVLRLLGILFTQHFHPLLSDTISWDNGTFTFDRGGPLLYAACEHEMLSQGCGFLLAALEWAAIYLRMSRDGRSVVLNYENFPTLLRGSVTKLVIINQAARQRGSQSEFVMRMLRARFDTLVGRGLEEGYGKASGFADYSSPVTEVISKLEEEIGGKNEWNVLRDWMTAVNAFLKK